MDVLLMLLVAVAAGVATWWWLRRRLVSPARHDLALTRIEAAHGPARLALTASLLTQLAQAPASEIIRIWDRLELPLLAVLPDCPPAAKPVLVERLDALAKACSHRETARRILDLRNGLVGPTGL